MSRTKKIELITAIIVLGGAVIGFVQQLMAGNSQPQLASSPQPPQQPASQPDPLVKPKSRFYCSFEADEDRGGQIWTVMYRSDSGTKPWLRMVRTMGGGWDTQARCEEIARRVDIFNQDGLLGFNYRPEPKTPGQYVLCAKTKISGDGCPLVLTLMPADNPYQELQEVAGALLPGSLPSYQCNNSQNCPPPQPLEISLKDQL